MAPESETPSSAGPAVKCLLIDADPQARQAVPAALEAAGYDCACAAGLAEALAALARSEFAVAIADQEFVGDAGAELRRQLERQRPPVPLVVLSGVASLESAVAAVAARAVAYVPKPVDPAQLLAGVEAAVERRQAADRLCGTQQRLEQWRSELEALQGLVGAADAPPRMSLQGYFALSMRQLTAVLADLYRYCEATALVEGAPRTEEATTRLELATAQSLLRETIAVLEQTKSSFRSKQLGRLRHRLEDALERIDSRGPAAP